MVLKKAFGRIKLDQLAKAGAELREDELRQINGGMSPSMVCTKTGGGWTCSGDGMND
ncbi:hypothetical protein [Dactylosporangium sp. NPDC051541]|uniref:hypothetical protein n=1 Tax=Dactylosporangium sp. NPDC051541 TaxID=3363977 RepID=UPI0037BC2C23